VCTAPRRSSLFTLQAGYHPIRVAMWMGAVERPWLGVNGDFSALGGMAAKIFTRELLYPTIRVLIQVFRSGTGSVEQPGHGVTASVLRAGGGWRRQFFRLEVTSLR